MSATVTVYIIVTHEGWGESTSIDSVFASRDLALQRLAADGFVLDEDDHWCRTETYRAMGAEREHNTYATIQEHGVTEFI